MTLTETAGASKGRGAENGPGGAEAGGGATSDATYADADAAVVGVYHGTEKGKGRGSPAGGKTRPASPKEWEREKGPPRPP